jgi:DNA-binding PadR family transcriptional regulator
MTNSEFAILSLVAEQPRYGYEIERVIEMRGMRDWTDIGFSSIYYLLNKLEKSGLIEGRLDSETGRGPSRKVYHITSSGQQAWYNAQLEALSVPQPCHPALQIGLSNLPAVDPNEAIAALRKYLGSLQELQSYLRQREQQGQALLPFHVSAMFDLSQRLLQAEAEWIAGFIQQLEKGI